MNLLRKRFISAVCVCAAVAAAAAAAQGNFGQNGERSVMDDETAEREAYRRAKTDLVFWYQDAAYADFFELAAERYYEKTGIKAAVSYRQTLNYIGDIYDETMRCEAAPDVYLISGDNLEEAYLYGLAAVNERKDSYGDAADNAVAASCCQGKMLGYPLSYNICVLVYQNGYFDAAPDSLQAIIDYSDENEPEEHVEYLLEWNVNDAFYDFPFISNSVTFVQEEAGSVDVVYDEELYQKDLAYFEEILTSFSIDADEVSEESIIENFLAGRTLCAIIDTNSLAELGDYSYSLMELPALNEELSSSACGLTDMLVVNDFSESADEASDFAEFVTTELSGELHGASGRYSVFLPDAADEVEKIAYQAYESSVPVPNSQDARDFWVNLKETIAEYF